MLTHVPLRYIACFLLVALLTGGGALLPLPVTADGGAYAAVVINIEGGALREYCIDLGADGVATGTDVLRATGLPVIEEVGGMGAAICKIENTGCNFPAQGCWCECTMMPGEPCRYWAYHHLLDGQWEQSNRGASTYQVTAGAVEGWSWGNGTVANGTEPPLRTYEQVCTAVLATATPVPPTATPRPAATSTTLPTASPQPTGTLIQATATTEAPTATVEATGATAPTATPSLPTVTPQPPEAPATEEVATATPPPPETGSESTPEPSSNGEQGGAGEVSAPTSTPINAGGFSVSPTPARETEGAAPPPLTTPVISAATPTVAGIALQPVGGTAESVLPPSPAEDSSDMWLYGIVAFIVAGLVGIIGWVWYQQRGY